MDPFLSWTSLLYVERTVFLYLQTHLPSSSQGLSKHFTLNQIVALENTVLNESFMKC